MKKEHGEEILIESVLISSLQLEQAKKTVVKN